MNLKDRLDRAYSGKGAPIDEAPPARQAGASPSGRAKQAGSQGGRIPASPRPADDRRAPRPPASGAPDGLLKKTGDRGYRKVAKFLLLLGQEEAALVMRHLRKEELEGIVREMATIGPIEKVEAEAILGEFDEVRKGGASLEGGEGAARGILVQAFGQEGGDRILKKALPASAKPFSFLSGLDSIQLLLLLKQESPQVMSIVLPYVEPKTASELIMKLDAERRSEVIKRMARLEKVSPEIIGEVEEGLRRAAEKLERVDTEEINGAEALAGILRHVDPGLEEEILGDLENLDPLLSDSIRDRLFTLEDVERVSGRDLQVQLRTMADRDIALLLKGKADGFRQKVLSCVSKERRSMILEEYEILGSVRKQDVDLASRGFLARLKSLYESGDLVLEGDEDVVR